MKLCHTCHKEINEKNNFCKKNCLEVNGDYWHCNPKVYKKGAINEMQKSHIRRDFAKKGFAAKQGYYLVTIWEKDIKEKSEKIKEWLLSKIKFNIVEKKHE